MGLVKWFKGLFDHASQLGDDDIVVFVVGPSGSGKSLFVEEVTKSGLIKVGTDLQPRTTNVQAIRCELTEGAKTDLRSPQQKHIVFVDTPSFHTAIDDGAAEKAMKHWLSGSKSMSTLVGTIYMHRVETNPDNEPIRKHLNTFAHTFPQRFVSLPWRLHAVFSYEGVIPEATIRDRKEKFEKQLHTLPPSLGGKLNWVPSFHPDLFQGGNPETAWRAVVALFSHSAPTEVTSGNG